MAAAHVTRHVFTGKASSDYLRSGGIQTICDGFRVERLSQVADAASLHPNTVALKTHWIPNVHNIARDSHRRNEVRQHLSGNLIGEASDNVRVVSSGHVNPITSVF